MTEKELDELVEDVSKKVEPITGYILQTQRGNFFVTSNIDKQLTGIRLVFRLSKKSCSSEDLFKPLKIKANKTFKYEYSLNPEFTK